MTDAGVNWRQDGAADGPVLLMAHALSTDLRVFDGLMPHLPPDMRIIRADMRGHGQSAAPPGPYAMGTLVRDLEQLIDSENLRDIVLLGVSIGGMIAQGLAAKRPGLFRGLILSNTAPRIGTRPIWEDRIAAIEAGTMAQYADATFDRWFGPVARRQTDLSRVRAIVERQNRAGVVACAQAIAGSDFYTTTAALPMPVLVIAGDRDGSTPPDMVREMADLIEGARFELIRGAGHLPFVEKPAQYGGLVTGFCAGLPPGSGSAAQ